MLAHARSQKHRILSFGFKIQLLLNFEGGGEAQQDLPSAFWIKKIGVSQFTTHRSSSRTLFNRKTPIQIKKGASGFRRACTRVTNHTSK